MFFEDNIDNNKYCGHLYGLGTSFIVNGNNYNCDNGDNNSSWFVLIFFFFIFFLFLFGFCFRFYINRNAVRLGYNFFFKTKHSQIISHLVTDPNILKDKVELKINKKKISFYWKTIKQSPFISFLPLINRYSEIIFFLCKLSLKYIYFVMFLCNW